MALRPWFAALLVIRRVSMVLRAGRGKCCSAHIHMGTTSVYLIRLLSSSSPQRRADGSAMSILVTGGAGYIGSATVERLKAKGEGVVVLDDLFRGCRAAVAEGVPFYEGRVGDQSLVERIVSEHNV